MDLEGARALVERQARAWEREDVSAIVAEFAPDGVLSSPGGRFEGHEALRRAATAFFAVATSVRITITSVLLTGDEGALEWTWSEARRSDGQRRTVDDGIFFTLRDDRLVSWREYFDPSGSVFSPSTGFMPVAQPEVADAVHGGEDHDAHD
jgi:uncharacterized protein (TIGR02246 family)